MKAYMKTLIISGLMAGLCACAGNNDGMESQTQQGLTADIEDNGMLNAGDHALDLGHGDVNRPNSYGANDLHALQIADLAEDTPGVSRSSAIVSRQDIIVAIEIRNPSEASTLEQEVARRIQAREPGYTIHVTSNHQMNARIRSLTENAANPYSQPDGYHSRQNDIQTDINQIIRDINQMKTQN